MNSDVPYYSTLPTGHSWTANELGHMTVWSIWRRLSALALARGEGVELSVQDDGSVSIRTVYAPLYETSHWVVDPAGDAGSGEAHEQNAPKLPEPTEAHRTLPWRSTRGW